MTISAQDVTFRYPKTSRPALRGLDFDVTEGEIFGFLGPSGAGKSTTLGILTGTLAGWSGRIDIGGIDPSKAGADFYRDIGVCFESPRFHMKFSAVENLRLFGALYGTPLRDIREIMNRLGLGNDLDKKVEAYSKGMKTRLSLARSILHNPTLLFLDEPTNGLDPSLTRTVCNLILEEKQNGKTIFLTTHDMQTATLLCDRVGFLSEGVLAVVDAPSVLAQRYGTSEVRLESNNPETGIKDFAMEGLADNLDFLKLLRSGEIRTIHSREAALGDIFMKVTGSTLV